MSVAENHGGLSLLAVLPDAVVVLDGEGHVLVANPAAEELAGRPLPTGSSLDGVMHPDDVEEIRSRAVQRRMHPHDTVEMRVFRPDGTERWVEAVGADCLDDPAIGGFVVVARDADDQVRTRADLASREALLTAVLEATPDGVFRLDPDLRIEYASAATAELGGFAPEQIVGRTPEELGYPDELVAAWRAHVEEVFRTGRARVREFLLPAPGGPRWIESRVVPEPPVDGVVEHVVAVVRDVDETRAQRLALEAASLEDPLTGLANRRHFLAALERALRRRLRSGRPLAVLYLDLDDFKPVNDAFGHHVGDDVLVVVADRLRRSLRPGDLAARHGGDEFTVLLDEVAGVAGALVVAERVRSAVQEPVAVDRAEVEISVSVGVAVAQGSEAEATALLRRADDAMYEAKRRGRNQVVVQEGATTARDARLAEQLLAAADDHRLVLHYQPELDLATDELVSVEALLRWEVAGGPVRPAGEFVQLAEQIGLLHDLLPHLIDEALAAVASWRRDRPRPALRLRTNLSPRQLLVPDLDRLLVDALGRHQVPADAVGMEVWSEAIGPTTPRVAGAIASLRRIGVGTGIDGFGRAAIQLEQLQVTPDVVCLDRFLVAGLGRGGMEEAIVRGVVAAAHDVGVRVVACGVERPDQLQRAAAIGVDGVQGMLISRPRPAPEIPHLLRGWRGRGAG